MAITEAFSGSAVIDAEYSLPANAAGASSQTDDGIYQVVLDLSELTATEHYHLTVREKCRTGDTQRNVFKQGISGAQANPIFMTPSFIFLHGWDVTLTKISGVARSIAWSIRKVA